MINADTRATFERALRRTYEAIAHDMWGGEAVDHVEAADTVIEYVEVHGNMTREQFRQFNALTLAEQRYLALRVL